MTEAKGWALILGASSGFGGATPLELARNGFDIFGVHLDLRSTLPNAAGDQKDIEDAGPQGRLLQHERRRRRQARRRRRSHG